MQYLMCLKYITHFIWTSRYLRSEKTNVPFGRTLRKGMHDLKVWPESEPDVGLPSRTPGKSKDANDKMTELAKVK